MNTQNTLTGAEDATLSADDSLRWDNPLLWQNITTGTCRCCKNGAHVLRNGLCWTCEQENAGKHDINA